MALACPACGFRTLGEDLYGSYAICQVCGWEDDPVQLANPCSGGGANAASLHEHQRQTLAANPSDGREQGDARRDPAWRPLTDAEIARARNERSTAHWTHPAVIAPEDAYWRTTPVQDPD